jgi:hypothetical protein
MKNILDVGCGRRKLEGAIGIDSADLPEVDIKHDLNIYPWPIKGDYFSEIHINHVIEHLDSTIKLMEEVYRICENGARVFIRVPHASCSMVSWQDPTHKRPYTCTSFYYFSKEYGYSYYHNVNFKIKKVRLNYCLYDGAKKERNRIPKWFQNIWNTLANFNYTSQLIFERFLAGYIGGFEELYVELEVIK